MRLCCVICGQPCLQADDVSAIPCGHVFHTDCLMKWLHQSKTCPQCRHKTTPKSLNKLYFDPGCDDDDRPDPDALQMQIDNLQFQMKMKEQDVRIKTDENGMLKAQSVALREEYKSLEKDLRDKDTTILAFKTQLKNVDRVTSEAKKAKEDAKKLREELNLLKGVEKVLTGTNEDVETILQSHSSSNARSLATFISVLKRELSQVSEEKRKQRVEAATATRRHKEATKLARGLQDEVDTLSSALAQLQQDNESLEKENTSLRKKVQALEQAIASPSDDVRNSALHRLLSESPAPEFLKRLHSASLSDSVTPEILGKRQRTSSESEPKAATEDEEEAKVETIDLTSPVQKERTKLSEWASRPTITPVRPLADSVNIMKGSKLLAKPKHSSLKLVKKVGINVGYDGLGGHHKFDAFPSPRTPAFQVTARKKYTVKKPGGGGGRGRVGGAAGSSKPSQSSLIHDYFKNTFESEFD